MEIITSRDNRKLKFVRAVREGKDKDYIFIEGVRLAEEALRSGLRPEEILISDNLKFNVIREDNLKLIIEKSAIVVENKLFNSIADTDSSQGIIMVAERPRISLTDIENALGKAHIPTVIYLNQINNPSNVGAIFRTAEAAGVAGVIISDGAADAFSPKALRGAMGANLRLPVVEGVKLDQVLNWADSKGLVATAADIKGERSYTDTDWKTGRLLVFGSEAHGLGEEGLEQMKETINIPMENDVESLNIAVSAGIILFEAKRQVSL